MLKTKNKNSNYLAKVVKITNIRPHENADRLAVTTVDFQNIITSKDTKVGNLYIYFPLECQINKNLLSFSNCLDKPEENRNKEKKGFFSSKNCRVKATKLRGILSEGYIHSVQSFNEWLSSRGIKYQISDGDVGAEFDTIDTTLICQKYLNPEVLRLKKIQQKNDAKKNKKVANSSRLIENQYRLAEDTKQLKKEIYAINPDDYITISYKLHGTNFSAGRVLGKKSLSGWKRILQKLNFKIEDSEHDLFYASRRVIKNGDFDNSNKVHFYNSDIWGDVAKDISEKIIKGISIHGEIVGYTKDGQHIQKDYDYGCSPGEYRLFVYRIFYTSPDGTVIEFSTPQIIQYCKKYGLDVVPIFYYGKASEFLGKAVQQDFHKELLEKLTQLYLEKDCYMCNNKVPAEGIVVTNNSEYYKAFKLKSLRFFERETKEIDAGTVSVEDIDGAE